MKEFLLNKTFLENTTNFDLLFYFIVPVLLFALCYLAINGMVLKKKLDVGFIALSCILVIALQWVTKGFFENLLASETITNNAISFRLPWMENPIKLFKGDTTTTTITTYAIYPILFIAIDAAMGLASAIFHNLLTDERTTSFSQGMRAVVASVGVCVVFFLIGTGVLNIQINPQDLMGGERQYKGTTYNNGDVEYDKIIIKVNDNGTTRYYSVAASEEAKSKLKVVMSKDEFNEIKKYTIVSSEKDYNKTIGSNRRTITIK